MRARPCAKSFEGNGPASRMLHWMKDLRVGTIYLTSLGKTSSRRPRSAWPAFIHFASCSLTGTTTNEARPVCQVARLPRSAEQSQNPVSVVPAHRERDFGGSPGTRRALGG